MSGNEATTQLKVRQLTTVLARPDVQIIHTILDPREEIPWHVHTEVTDTFYVVKGPLTIMSRNPVRKVSIPPGEIYRVEAGQPHRVLNDASTAAEYFLIQGLGSYDFKRA